MPGKIKTNLFYAIIILLTVSIVFTGCKQFRSNRGAGETLAVEEVDPGSINDGSGGTGSGETGDDGQILPDYGEDGLHPIFSGKLGMPIATASLGVIDPDPTGLDTCSDYDGDGISNSREITSNVFVADYPRIVTRVAPPITMEIRVSESSEMDNYSQTVTEKDVKDTITNSMEEKHYNSAQQKTTPYVTKESLSESGSHADSFGYANSDSYTNKDAYNSAKDYSASWKGCGVGISTNYGKQKERTKSTSRSENSSIEDSFASSTMSEKTVFENVDYVDNMDRNGVEFTSETVENISTNYRRNTEVHTNESVGPNAGFVRAALYLKNVSVNMPVHISDVVCTLSFRTPSGQFLPVKTFRLRNEDYSEFSEDVYGDEELGPYTIEIENLNTREVRLALANGYIPQVHVVSYDMGKVSESNYDPGVNNLKIVEETAKGRTALIKIIGTNSREIYRVAAFDVEGTDAGGTPYTGDETERRISPGISLKKALFNIFRDYIGDGETWETDMNGDGLTIADTGLKWKAGAADKSNYVFGTNMSGNSWNNFETYVKSYEDNGEIYRIETIKRIGSLVKYNPFSKEDNSNYNPNELMSRDEVLKMKFWVIFHNGRYFEGDLNDPVWAGDRYEIVCMDMMDFNERVENYVYTPFLSGNRFYMDSRWNSLSNEEGEFARSIYLGKVIGTDIIQLEVNLMESRFLFQEGGSAEGFGLPVDTGTGSIYYNYNYTFEPTESTLNGIPDKFDYSASGGVNNIWVTIDQAENAKSYRIVFREMVPPDGYTAITKSVSVLREEIEESGGSFIITSKTLDINENPIGLISGTPEVSEGGTAKSWKVEVYANGTLNGVNVFTKGDSQNNIAYVTEPDSTDPSPKAFVFSGNGTTDAIEVRIHGAADTEYYLIKCKGPFNYYDEASVPEVQQIAYPGYNAILFTKHPSLRPSFENLDAKSFETGVYTIDVYAVNRYNAASAGECDVYNTPGDCVPAGNGSVFAEVNFDRYVEQRKYEPRVSKNLFDLNAVDLEVNFDDGSGWFKLQAVDPFEYGAQGDDPSRIIDCYYSSYMDKDEQKFFINFKAPDGSYGLPNVFFGGRTEAKVYLRTIPKQKYRDSFWPITDIEPLTGNPVPRTTYEDEKIYLDFNIFNLADDFNIVDYWTSSDKTDASEFEEMVKYDIIDGFYDSVKQCLLGKTGTVTDKYDDFFFSPAEHRIFVVKATVEPDAMIQEPYRPDPPAYNTTPPFPEFQTVPPSYTYDCIEIKNIYASHSSGYEIYWAEGTVTVDTDSEGWRTNPEYNWKGSAVIEGRDYYTINQLDYNQVYTVAVAAKNKYGTSAPAVRQVAVPNPPAEIPAIPSGTIQVNENGIYVVDIVSENAAAFLAYWKLESQEGETINPVIWKSLEVIGGALHIEQDEIMSAINTVGIYNDRVVLRVIPVNSDNAMGPYWEKILEPIYCNVILSEPITNPDSSTAYGEFGHSLVNKYGLPLTNGVDFVYDQPLNSGLYNLYDNGDYYSFEAGKLFRIVVEGLNVSDLSGYGLTPVAKNFGQGLQSPPGNQVYIDPMSGQFTLPRPIYWSRCDSLENLSDNPEISYSDLYMNSYNNPFESIVTGKFVGNAYGVVSTDSTIRHRRLFPLGLSHLPQGQFTVSFWMRQEGFGYMTIGESGSTVLLRLFISGGNSYYEVYENGSYENGYCTTSWNIGNFVHFYIVFDNSAGLSNSDTVKVYVNNILLASINGLFPDITVFNIIWGNHSSGPGRTYIDNLKIWSEILGDSSNYSTWIYNYENNESLTNTEDNALHPIYGEANGYKPNMIDLGSVGYHYKPE